MLYAALGVIKLTTGISDGLLLERKAPSEIVALLDHNGIALAQLGQAGGRHAQPLMDSTELRLQFVDASLGRVPIRAHSCQLGGELRGSELEISG